VPTAIRPNGKSYVRSKPPGVIEVESYYDCCATEYLVLRTHDMAEAEALVPADIREGYTAILGWTRESICICGGGHSRDYIYDPEHGVPCITFRGDGR
jgi:hypothetical protein